MIQQEIIRTHRQRQRLLNNNLHSLRQPFNMESGFGDPEISSFTPSRLKDLEPPKTPQEKQPLQATERLQKSGRRHHRTATPEQRSIRAMTNGVPVFTIGMNPQGDRSLINDFFDHIKNWATRYTVHIKSLRADRLGDLVAHPVIAANFGEPAQLLMLLTEKDILVAMIAGIISRNMHMYTMGEHFIHASGHSLSNVCEDLALRWTASELDFNAQEAQHDLLQQQQRLYTAIKNSPDHKAWRSSRAEALTRKLITDLDGLLVTNLSPRALTERNHVLSELFVKGYRVGFRMHMAPTKWHFEWPTSGVEFNPALMVNESRNLYGDLLETMKEVMRNPRAHAVQFAVSPTIVKRDFSSGVESRVVVHNALVYINRKTGA